MKHLEGYNPTASPPTLVGLLRRLYREMLEDIDDRPFLRGGTTLVVAVLQWEPGRLATLNLGDSFAGLIDPRAGAFFSTKAHPTCGAACAILVGT